jgi:hypothetical protein
VDEDGTVEIVTVGCMGVSSLCDPDLRVWSIPREPVSFPYFLLVTLGAVVVTVLVIAFFFVKKRQN